MLKSYELTKRFTDGILEGLTIVDTLDRCSNQPFVLGQIVKDYGGSEYEIIAIRETK